MILEGPSVGFGSTDSLAADTAIIRESPATSECISASLRPRESLRLALVDKPYVIVRNERPRQANSRMDESTPETPSEDAAATVDTAEGPAAAPTSAELEGLSTYARSLLRIRVPLHVTLAAQRKSIHEIVELGPGSIVKFDKTCDEPLELSIGNQAIAQGEVVKVGDKFGLRISGLVR